MTNAAKTGRGPHDFAAHFHLLGCVDFEDCLSAQRRLAYDALSRGDGRIVVLLCEHPELITIGRAGSRADLHFTPAELEERHLEVRYLSRGGGALLHGPGQLAIYPVVPLAWHNWSVGSYLRLLRSGIAAGLLDLGVRSGSLAGQFSLWGRRGLLAAVGIAVKHGVATQGVFLNVSPDMRLLRRFSVAGQSAARPAERTGSAARKSPQSRAEFSSLLSEQGRAVKMASVRAAMVQHLAEALGCENYHLHTGHPFLAEMASPAARLGNSFRESAA